MSRSWPLAWLFRVACCALVWVGSSAPAQASWPPLESDVAALGASDSAAVGAAITRMSGAADARALPILEALDDGKLRIDSSGHAFIAGGGKLEDAHAVGGVEAAPVGSLTTPALDNTVRRALLPALAALRLTS